MTTMHHLDYVKIKDLAEHMGMKMGELRKVLVSLDILEQRMDKYKNPYLLTDLAVSYGIGEIRVRPYNHGLRAPYNIYFPNEIEEAIKLGIPLSSRMRSK